MGVNSIQIPPDSSGKRIATEVRIIIQFDNQTGALFIGDVVDGFSSGASGTITAIETFGFASNSGELYLQNVTGGPYNDGENLQVSAVTKAVADLTTVPQATINTQHVVIADHNNPARKQKIDACGNSLVTFSDGAPLFGGFGDLQVATLETIAEYRAAYDAISEKWFDNTTGNGAVSFLNPEGAVLLDTGGTASGDAVIRTTHMYHPVQLGTQTLIFMTVVLGDVGKTNNRRRWGFFDDDNGFFWELDNATLYQVVRNETVDTRIEQVNFSDNTLLGTSTRPFTLNITNVNLYFFEIVWPAGRIQMGVITEWGERRIGHTFEFNNAQSTGFIKTITLPVRLETVNTNITGSNSQIKLFGATVKSVGPFARRETHFSHPIVARKTIANTDGEKPIISLRPRTTFQSDRNSVIGLLDDLSIGSNGAFQYAIRVRRDASLTAASWADHDTPNSAFQKDVAATGVTGGTVIWSRMVDGNQITNFNLSDELEKSLLDELFRMLLEADNTTQQTLTVTIETIDVGSSGYIYTTEWVEFQL